MQDPGFFTAVSSNGRAVDSAVIWAVSRPQGGAQENVRLFAFNETGDTLFSGVAGTWPNTGGNSNIAPIVANGRVYVASFQGLATFGLSSGPAATLPASVQNAVAARAPLPVGQHEVFGTVRALSDGSMVVAKRGGETLTVDTRLAMQTLQYAQPRVGHGVLVRGNFRPDGTMTAATVLHAKDSAQAWQADR